MDQTLELYDLDGTMNTIDVVGAINQKGQKEVLAYLISASEFVAQQTGLPQTEIYLGMCMKLLGEIFPARADPKFWAAFSANDGQKIKVAPAVNHCLLVPHAVRLYLQDRQNQERPGSSSHSKIGEFLLTDWEYPLFKYCSSASLPHAAIGEDAISVIESRLRNNALAAIFINSSTDKAVTLLERAGFGNFIEMDGVKAGRFGVIGDTRKFLVDVSMPISPFNQVDLRPFGMDIDLDLRRSVYREKVRELMRSVDTSQIFMASDVPELDLYPLKRWYGPNALVAMKTNPTSAPESIQAAQTLLRANVSARLSDLVQMIDVF